jgi:putative lipoprotein
MLKAVAALALVASLAISPVLAAKLNLPGEVTYRERIALPDSATLTLELIDLALPDLPRLSVSAPTGSGQVPLSFNLTFEDSLILPQHNYALNAEISADGFMFRNVEPYPVTPLAQTEPVVIVTNVVAQSDATSSEPPAAAPALAILGTTWEATSIGGTPVPSGVEITLLIESDMRAGGVGGCNSYFSQAQIGENSFMIGEVARTMRSCLYERNMLEKSYFDALKAATAWVIDNGTLSLLDSTGKPLLQFES